jgi:ketosteroid isomerase-like protein
LATLVDPAASRNSNRVDSSVNTLETWHDIIKSMDPERLDEVLAEDCVFISPVVHKPQAGRDLTRLYLTGAMGVFNDSFHYVKEVVAGDHAVLEFVCEVDGIMINGVDILTFDSAGKICEFKVMVRPLKAMNLLHGKMRAMLEQLSA